MINLVRAKWNSISPLEWTCGNIGVTHEMGQQLPFVPRAGFLDLHYGMPYP